MSYGRQPRHVVVVGSGISGLTAAYLVCQAGRGAVRVTVVEKGPVVGGHLRVAEVAGLPIDEGAESLLLTHGRRPSNWPARPGSATTWNTRSRPPPGCGVAALSSHFRRRRCWACPRCRPISPKSSTPTTSRGSPLNRLFPVLPLLDDDVAVGTVVRTEWVPRSRSGWSSHSSAASTPAGPTSCRFGRRCPTWPLRFRARVPCCEPRHQCGKELPVPPSPCSPAFEAASAGCLLRSQRSPDHRRRFRAGTSSAAARDVGSVHRR